MYNFFVDKNSKENNTYLIGGGDFNHIKNVLRMKEGEKFLVSADGKSDLVKLIGFNENFAVAEIIEEDYNPTNLPIKIYLFQGLPKSDKLELIIQKCVELGVHEIIPVEMHRSIVKVDQKKNKAKTERYQAIAESAAKQSKRNYVPQVLEAIPFSKMLEKAKEMDLFLIPYECENGMNSTKDALNKLKSGSSVGILIGPEGGIDDTEIEKATNIGGIPISLGARILRTETAAITSVAMLMLHTEMNI